MSLTSEEKSGVVEKFRMHSTDTGSADVQVALITNRLSYLEKHFATHIKDFHSQRGLLKLVGKRRRLLDYIKRTDVQRYRELIQRLGIRK